MKMRKLERKIFYNINKVGSNVDEVVFHISYLIILPIPCYVDLYGAIETVSPEGTFCDTVQVPSGAGDMQLI